MTLPVKTEDQFVSDQVTTWGAQTNTTPLFQSGDMLLAVFQAFGVQLMFLQAQAQLIVNLTRAATSTGADLDSWMADYGFVRLPPDLAEGEVVMGKNAAGPTAIQVQPGVTVQTPGAAIQYQVIADTAQAAWSAVAGAYVLPAGQTSMQVTVQALTIGSSANVNADALTQLGSSVAGIDTVNNPAAIGNGADAESDDAFRARFVAYLATLANATAAAILVAIGNVQQGLSTVLLENQNPALAPQLGAFTAVVDDGSGAPSAALLASVFNAVNNTRAFTVQPYVDGPNVVEITVAITVRVAAGYTAASVNAAVQAAIVAEVNSLTTGQEAYISSIEGAATGVAGVVSVRPGYTLINGVAADYAPSVSQRIQTASGVVTVSNY